MNDSLVRRNVTLSFVVPIMFDRFGGDINRRLEPEEKFYFANDQKTLVLPAANLKSFLVYGGGRQDPAVKILSASGTWKTEATIIAGSVLITPDKIPFTRDGEPVVFEGFGKNGIQMDERKAGGGSHPPEMVRRPMVELPLELNFDVQIYTSEKCSEQQIRELFSRGGIAVGLGAFRTEFGKFVVDKWENAA